MKTAYAISGIGHAAILLWGVWSLTAKPLPALPPESMPVDVISASEFSQITKGAKNAPKAETPMPPVEKVAEEKPVEDTTAKVVEKKEVKATREPPPALEAKPVEPKPPEPKLAEQKQPEPKPEKKRAETKPDPIADVLAKDEKKKPETKKPEKKAEAKPPMPPRKPAPPAPKFDPNQVAALLDKRDPTRVAAAGNALSAPSLGLSNGQAAQLSMSELDALRARLGQLWSIPAGAQDPQELVVLIRIQLKRDGTLAGPPMVLTSGQSPLFIAARDSAVRAVFRGQPYDMLKPEHYEQWKDIEITFDPRDMIRG